MNRPIVEVFASRAEPPQVSDQSRMGGDTAQLRAAGKQEPGKEQTENQDRQGKDGKSGRNTTQAGRAWSRGAARGCVEGWDLNPREISWVG